MKTKEDVTLLIRRYFSEFEKNMDNEIGLNNLIKVVFNILCHF